MCTESFWDSWDILKLFSGREQNLKGRSWTRSCSAFLKYSNRPQTRLLIVRIMWIEFLQNFENDRSSKLGYRK